MNEYGSVRGIPAPCAMIRPVATCVSVELSLMARARASTPTRPKGGDEQPFRAAQAAHRYLSELAHRGTQRLDSKYLHLFVLKAGMAGFWIGSAVYRLQEGFVAVDPAMAQALGYTAEEMAGRSGDDFMYVDDPEWGAMSSLFARPVC